MERLLIRFKMSWTLGQLLLWRESMIETGFSLHVTMPSNLCNEPIPCYSSWPHVPYILFRHINRSRNRHKNPSRAVEMHHERERTGDARQCGSFEWIHTPLNSQKLYMVSWMSESFIKVPNSFVQNFKIHYAIFVRLSKIWSITRSPTWNNL